MNTHWIPANQRNFVGQALFCKKTQMSIALIDFDIYSADAYRNKPPEALRPLKPKHYQVSVLIDQSVDLLLDQDPKQPNIYEKCLLVQAGQRVEFIISSTVDSVIQFRKLLVKSIEVSISGVTDNGN